MAAYARAALALSIWAMRGQSLDWGLVFFALALPASIAALVYRRALRPAR